MPRLDNSTIDTVWRFGDLETHDWNDPGANAPYDFCASCWARHVVIVLGDMEVDHPPYDEGRYRCIKCGVALDSGDDEGGDPLTS